MNLREKAAKGVLWSLIQKWGRALVSISTFVILSRLLAPEAFGLVALASAFVLFVELFQDQGFSAAIVQRVNLEREHLDTAFWISLSVSVLFAATTIAASGQIAGFFGEPALAPVLAWLSISFIISALRSTQTAILQRNLAFKSLAARSLIATVVGGAVGIGMAYSGFGVWSLVGQDLVSGIVGVLVLWRTSDWRPGFHVSKRHYQDLVSFGVGIVGNNALNLLVRRSDDFLIGYFLGPTALGFYTVGYQLLLVIIRLVTEVTNSVAFPTFSRLQSQPERMRRAFYKVTQYTSLVAFPIFIGIAAVAPELVPVVFGEKWAQSIPIMQVLALVGILQSVQFFNGSVIRASGKSIWQFNIMLVNAIATVIGFLIAVNWGIVAVAASLVIVGYLLAPLSFDAVRKLIQIDFSTYIRQFVAPLAASVMMVAVIYTLKYLLADAALTLYMALSIYVVAGALTYGVVIALTAPSLYSQVLNLVAVAVPGRKLRKSI
jgi:O-antigen/teichoic acid export membrane protein